MSSPSAPQSRQPTSPGAGDGEKSESESKSGRGPLEWMTRNSVAANLLMLCLCVGGILAIFNVKQEVFPQFEMDTVIVSAVYPGASPSEVEQGAILAIEEAVREVDGVKEVRSTANEGAGVVMVDLQLSAQADRALSDIKSAVDRITSFPKDVERPVVSLASNRREVITMVIYGKQDERTLRRLAEQAREELVAHKDISVVDMAAVRPLEVSIEVPREELRRYGLTLDQIAAVVQRASVDVPGGGVKTQAGEILLRTTERRRNADEFESIVVLSRPDGSLVKLGHIATVKDGFRETDQSASFNGLNAAMVKVYRVGKETPTQVSDAVHEYLRDRQVSLPEGVKLATWSDWSQMYTERLDLLRRNALSGLVLVMFVLALFLELRLAFWVTLGIPISFLGALMLLPGLDASINMISLFAFIVTLGLVVDDAIVVGEAVFKRRTEGASPLEAAISGVREVAVPVVFAVLTTIVAFSPMLFVPGIMGKFFRLLPIVVIAVLAISLIESLFILPAHLAHSKTNRQGFLDRLQRRFSEGVETFIEKRYRPFLAKALYYRYTVIAMAVGALFLVVGLIAGGRVNFVFFPKIEGDVVVADIGLPFGAPREETQAVTDKVIAAAQSVLEEEGGFDQNSRGLFAQVGSAGFFSGGNVPSGFAPSGSHMAEVAVYFVPVDDRSFTAKEFTLRWREKVGDIPGLDHLKFNYEVGGPGAGAPVNIELSHTRIDVLEQAAAELAIKLRRYDGVFDIDDGFSPGKQQLDFKLRHEARALGLNESDLARQIRSAFFGAEAVREQRGREEIRVFVRLPEAERRSEFDIESLMLKTPQGGEIALADAADIERGRSFTEIKRREGRRVVSVTADVDPAVTNEGKVVADVEADILPALVSKYKGLAFSLEGAQAAQRESLTALKLGFMFAIFGIYALLAVVFRNYFQPIIIMLVIPFGLIGAVVGHIVMGYDLSLMSMMGIVALSGVVVNDSLVLIDATNRFRRNGADGYEAVILGATRRFRAILLTSLTTFLGLMPMILETSTQARFLIPMAISLGFGVLFATVICLLLVPAVYCMLLDFGRWLRPPAPTSFTALPEAATKPAE